MRAELGGIDFVPKFVCLPSVSKILAQSSLLNPVITDDMLVQASAFTLDGELAQLLRNGCAYPHDAFKGTDKDVKQLGADFCDELFDDRYSEIIVLRSYSAWDAWFIDDNEIWNRSWFGFDKRTFTFWILALTDTD